MMALEKKPTNKCSRKTLSRPSDLHSLASGSSGLLPTALLCQRGLWRQWRLGCLTAARRAASVCCAGRHGRGKRHVSDGPQHRLSIIIPRAFGLKTASQIFPRSLIASLATRSGTCSSPRRASNCLLDHILQVAERRPQCIDLHRIWMSAPL